VELSENKNWQLINTGANTAEFNMNFDVELVERCEKEKINFIRFYTWQPYAISLGYNQGKNGRELKLDYEKCKNDGIDVVTRPTGGRAVLHSEELTYSVVLKSKTNDKEIYKAISAILLEGIKLIDANNDLLKNLSLVIKEENLLKLSKTGMYNFCFNSAIKHEINLSGKKLVGSAQRRFGNVILQHGSILLGDYHKNICNYFLFDNEAEKNKHISELNSKTISLEEILGYQPAVESLEEQIITSFEKNLSLELTAETI